MRKIKIVPDVYSTYGEAEEEGEVRSEFMYGDIFDEEFDLMVISASEVGNIKPYGNDKTVVEMYTDFAKASQKSYINQLVRNFNDDRIILLMDGKVLDGNHHIVAAYLLNKPVYAIDIGT